MRNLLKLLVLFKPYWGWAAAGVILSVLTIMANIALMTTSAWFITAMAGAGIAGASMNYFTPAAIIRGCAIVRTAGRYVERLISHEATFRFLGSLRQKLFTDLASHPLEKIEKFHSADISSRVQFDIDQLQSYYIKIIVPLVAGVISLMCCLAFVFQYHLQLSLIISAGLISAGLVVPFIAFLFARRYAQNIITSAKDLKCQSVDLLDGLGELISYQALSYAKEKINTAHTARLRALKSAQTLDVVTKNIIWLVSQLTFIATLICVLFLFQDGQVLQPDLVMLAMFALASFESVAAIAPALQTIPEIMVSADRVFRFEPKEKVCSVHSEIEQTTPDLSVEGVEFLYEGSSHVLKMPDFTLARSEKMMFTGPSGVGKSTLIDLLTNSRRIEKGTIRLNGENICTIDQDQLLQTFTIAPQKIEIFSGTIRDNLILGSVGIRQDEIEQALDISQLKEFIDRLPDGLETEIGETGYNLSGGQIRRIGLARALLKPAPILILDEPTEGLDVMTAERLVEALLKDKKDQSLMIITHMPLARGYFDKVIKFKPL